MPKDDDYFEPFSELSTAYPDSMLQEHSFYEFVPPISGKSVVKDKNRIDDVLNFLKGLNLENTSSLLEQQELQQQLAEFSNLQPAKNVSKAEDKNAPPPEQSEASPPETPETT